MNMWGWPGSKEHFHDSTQNPGDNLVLMPVCRRTEYSQGTDPG